MNSDKSRASDEYHFKLLRELSNGSDLSQRELSRKLGLSLGKVNYLVNSLVKTGVIKTKRFKNSKNKLAYMYILTPSGISHKIELTHKFLKRKIDEYAFLEKEIEMIKKQIEVADGRGSIPPV